MKRFFLLIVISLMCVTVSSAKVIRDFYPKQTPEENEKLIDSIVPIMTFQFIPSVRDGQVDGTVALPTYQDGVFVPLWLMVNMGGPLYVNNRTFVLTDCSKTEDRWILTIRNRDTTAGKFELRFVINTKKAFAMVKLINLASGREDMFQGDIVPLNRMRIFKNEREKIRVERYERMIDSIVPLMNFKIGSMAFTPKWLRDNYAEVVYCGRTEDMWFIRWVFRKDWSKIHTYYADIAVNVLTGEVYQRNGSGIHLWKNWMNWFPNVHMTSN